MCNRQVLLATQSHGEGLGIGVEECQVVMAHQAINAFNLTKKHLILLAIGHRAQIAFVSHCIHMISSLLFYVSPFT